MMGSTIRFIVGELDVCVQSFLPERLALTLTSMGWKKANLDFAMSAWSAFMLSDRACEAL